MGPAPQPRPALGADAAREMGRGCHVRHKQSPVKAGQQLATLTSPVSTSIAASPMSRALGSEKQESSPAGKNH